MASTSWTRFIAITHIFLTLLRCIQIIINFPALKCIGLTYGYNMAIQLSERILFFTLYRTTNVIDAFKQFKIITVTL